MRVECVCCGRLSKAETCQACERRGFVALTLFDRTRFLGRLPWLTELRRRGRVGA